MTGRHARPDRKLKAAQSGDMGVEIFYDGHCPLCRSYTAMLHLRAAAGRVELIDARSDDPRVATLRRAGVDLNEGMAVRHGRRLYHGAEAVQLLATLSHPGGPMTWLLKSPRRAALIYPFLRAGRSLLLRLLGRARL